MTTSDASRSGAKAPRRLWPFVLVAVLVLAAGWAFVARPWEPKPRAVVVETVTPGPATRVLAVNGRIVPRIAVDVRPTVSGQLLSLSAGEGDAVKMGELIATIDDAQQRAAVDQATAALDSALAQQGQAQLDLDRAESLGDTISRKATETAKLALETATRDVQRLQAARDQATSRLDEYGIRAPFAGTVLARGVDPGQVVDTSTVLYRIADLEDLAVEATVDELFAGEVKRGLEARLQPTGFNRTIDAEVSFVSPSVDTSTGGRTVRIAVPALDDVTLPVGLTVTTNIVVEARAEAITVPRVAVVDQRSSPWVLVITAGRAERRDIEFIDWPAERLIVSSGLAAGDVVILDPTAVAAGALVAAKAP